MKLKNRTSYKRFFQKMLSFFKEKCYFCRHTYKILQSKTLKTEWLMASVVSIIPIVLLFVLMLGFKMAGHKSALLTLVVTVLLALFAASPLGMIAPEHAEDSVVALTGWAVVEGILKAVFPILIIILMAIYSYNILVESKQIEVIKKQFTSITDDKGLLVLLLVWGFGGLLEGMAGFGTAVAIPTRRTAIRYGGGDTCRHPHRTRIQTDVLGSGFLNR